MILSAFPIPAGFWGTGGILVKATEDCFYDTTIQQGWLVTAWSYNVCNDFLRSMANYLNSIVNTDTFDYNYNLQNVSAGQTNDDALWDSLVNELNNI